MPEAAASSISAPRANRSSEYGAASGWGSPVDRDYVSGAPEQADFSSTDEQMVDNTDVQQDADLGSSDFGSFDDSV